MEGKFELAITASSAFFSVLRVLGFSSRRTFLLRVCGEPAWWTGAGDQAPQIGGFFTTRACVASSPEEASRRIEARIRSELREVLQNPPHAPLVLTVEEVSVLSGVVTASGGGFSMWTD
jgi:hypothetical protein